MPSRCRHEHAGAGHEPCHQQRTRTTVAAERQTGDDGHHECREPELGGAIGATAQHRFRRGERRAAGDVFGLDGA